MTDEITFGEAQQILDGLERLTDALERGRTSATPQEIAQLYDHAAYLEIEAAFPTRKTRVVVNRADERRVRFAAAKRARCVAPRE